MSPANMSRILPNRMLRLALLCLCLVAPFAAQAQSQFYSSLLGLLHAEDRQAVGETQSSGRAILEAQQAQGLSGERARDLADMFALMDEERRPVGSDRDLIGDCRIRSLQADRLGAYAYPFFRCRIFPEGRALLLRKESGSQRIFGHLASENAQRMLFAGAAYIYDETPRAYSGFDDNPSANSRKGDVTGHLYRLGPRRYLLMLTPKNGRFELFEIRR